MQILCATDFSKPAQHAADVAAALARKLNLPLRLLHCGQDWALLGDLPVIPPDDEPFRSQLRAEAERLRAGGGEVLEDYRHGSASAEVIAAAAEQPTALIVLGSLGLGLAGRWLLGSVAERVAEGAAVPTLVVREPALLLAWLARGTALRLLCAVDFTPTSDAALAQLPMLAELGRLEVEAVHLDESGAIARSAEHRLARQRDVWERLQTVMGEQPVKVHVEETAGRPAEEFLRVAEDRQPGLLLVGAHQRPLWRRLTAPSFSRATLVQAHTNVLCVPAAAAREEVVRLPVIRRVLVAVDLAEPASAVIRHAGSLLPAGGALHLLHVCAEPARGINPVIASEVYFDHSLATEKARADAAEKIQKLLPQIAIPGVTLSSEVLVHDEVAAGIDEAAERFGADAICLGAKGHSRAAVAFLGSTVQAVIARVHRPVLVVPPPQA